MSDSTAPAPPSSPPALDPPFRGYIETTYDSLLVFEAARRGMIPRVTRRLIERERGMVQSGAVFVFDEQESGIKRWTDGLVWSPSRILGNFLVYRETDKRPVNGASGTSPSMDSPGNTPSRSLQSSLGPMGPPQYAESSRMGSMSEAPIMSQGAMRQRSGSDASGMDKHRERQLVGSLTNSYKFKEGGLVKKTMSVQMQGYSQHMISYYTVEDVMSGKLRAPSTIPELASLAISPEYLQKQNFRFPPMIEVGPDGVPRYRGEPEDPGSPPTPMSSMSIHSFQAPEYDPYGVGHGMDPNRPHSRSMTAPMPMMHSPHGHPAHMSGGYAHSYFDQGGSAPVPIQRQGSSNALRPGSSSRRYDPYGPPSSSPRGSFSGISPASRRQSIPHTNADYYPSPQYDVKPIIHPSGQASYAYQPPPTAPGGYADYYGPSSAPPGPQVYPPPGAHSPTYAPTSWQPTPTHGGPSPGTQSRLLPSSASGRDYHSGHLNSGNPPPSSSTAGGGPPPLNEYTYPVPTSSGNGGPIPPPTNWQGPDSYASGPPSASTSATPTGDEWRASVS